MWNLQDRMKALQHQSQMADFSAAKQRMELSNDFSIQQEGIQGERMAANQDYQRWQRSFDYTGMSISRAWQREDWQTDDQRRALSFGWQMEDVNDAIRTSSGRERKDLLKQRDRLALTHNMDEQQVDKQRSRQEEQWSREDERFQKQAEYSEKLMELDQQNYDLGIEQRETFYKMDKEELARKMEEYLQQKKLQDQMQKKEREYQAKQLELQEKSLGVQAAAAKENKEYADQMTLVQDIMGNTEGYVKSIADHDPVEWFKYFDKFAQSLSKISYETASELNLAMRALSANNTEANADAISRLINIITDVDQGKIDRWIKLFSLE